MSRKEEKHHKKRKHKKSKHKHKHKKHKRHKKHKKRRHKKRHRAAPSGLPSLPTLEQNQYFMMQARVAGLEQQLLAQAKQNKEPKMSRAEEVDLLNQVLEEQDKQSRGRDRRKGSQGLTEDEYAFFKKAQREQEVEDDLERGRNFPSDLSGDSFESSLHGDEAHRSTIVSRPPRSPSPAPAPEPQAHHHEVQEFEEQHVGVPRQEYELQQAQQQPRSARLLAHTFEETAPSLAEQLQEGTPTPDRQRRATRRTTFIQDGPMGNEPFLQRGDDPFEQARGHERQSVARLTSKELEESTRPTRP
jgi:hypothetical protein